MKSGLQMDVADNVANVLTEVLEGETVTLLGVKNATIVATDDIRAFHKIALVDVALGEPIIRSGIAIGRAKRAITRGSLVHAHNLESMRL